MNRDFATLILRLAFGGLMLTHGYPKLIKLFTTPFSEITFADPLGIGPAFSLILTVLSEFVLAAFVLIGFRTRLASIPLAFTMVVAALIVHAGDSIRDREMALIYMAGFLAIALLGGGSYSLDGYLKKK